MRPKISVIVPCYNEKNTIMEILTRVEAVKIDKEMIVVCDGSTDGTKELLKAKEAGFAAKGTKVLYNEKNMGKGAAIRRGLSVANGEIVITQDADLELNPDSYEKLLEPFKKGEKVVFGSRFLENPPKIAFYSKFANWLVTFLANILYGARITDEACGYKVMSLEIYRSLELESNGFDFCAEVTAKVRKKGYRIHEVPVSFKPRTYKEGKKIQWVNGFETVWKLLKYRFAD
ncbi:MAG: glycosyltransferase family 2 protein [Endomicrobiales bacterium]|nr:glycosyltransferase family 2 protein [Endomicrobiales bacterium]